MWGRLQKNISAALKVPKNSVASIILRWKKCAKTGTGCHANLSNRGRAWATAAIYQSSLSLWPVGGRSWTIQLHQHLITYNNTWEATLTDPNRSNWMWDDPINQTYLVNPEDFFPFWGVMHWNMHLCLGQTAAVSGTLLKTASSKDSVPLNTDWPNSGKQLPAAAASSALPTDMCSSSSLHSRIFSVI